MEDKELFKNLLAFKDIKPSQEWLLLTKQRILGIEAKEQHLSVFALMSYPSLVRVFGYAKKPAFAMASFALILLAGAGVQAKNSVPGDPLYVLKAAAENVQYVFSSSEEKQVLRIEMAQRRLDDLKKVANSNDEQKISSVVKEYNETVARASDGFAMLVENEPAKALQVGKGIVQLRKDASQLEKVLGAAIGQPEGEFESAVKTLLENEIADLETRTLNENQQILLQEAKDAFMQEDYQTALEKIWTLSNIQ